MRALAFVNDGGRDEDEDFEETGTDDKVGLFSDNIVDLERRRSSVICFV